MSARNKEDGELSDRSSKTPEFGPNEDFIFDRTVSGIIPNEDLESNKSTETKSPWLKQMRKRLLLEPEEQDEEPTAKRRRGNCCFNCKGEHMIMHCPEPRDPNAIRRNKYEFQNSQQQPGGRISKAVENKSKYKPGRLSQKLRDALSLGPDDIPEWVYRMRRMGFHKGYPPGHLQKALKIEYNDIKIFSDDGEKPTEIDEKPNPSPTVDLKKVHFYMGFNKTYGALRDRERGRFEIPPFELFCEMLQTEVTKEHDASEKIRMNEERIRRQLIAANKPNEEEAIAVDREKTERAESLTPKKQDTPESGEGNMGESISQYVGTPVVSNRDKSGTWIESPVPPLEAFAVGIVPFEAREEDKPSGLFKKIMSTLRTKTD
ncbi:unnamed protein product [Caenorhabditis sp. 36 PRJEB53466]|nr:unnamed protein product [Caenorhabditis sp. 36 PRJEB53466]